jgi:hypothetical protein
MVLYTEISTNRVLGKLFSEAPIETPKDGDFLHVVGETTEENTSYRVVAITKHLDPKNGVYTKNLVLSPYPKNITQAKEW